MSAEINIFLDDGTGHIKYIIDDQLDAYDSDGKPIMAPANPVQVVALYKQLIDEAKNQGSTPGREPPRSYGGGNRGQQPRPEAPPPDGVPVPEHCGQPCEFKPAFTNPRNQNQVPAKFQCRSAQCPTKAQTGGYAWSVFLDRWLKEQVG